MQDNKFKYAYRCHDIIHAMYKVETEIIKKTLFSTTWQKFRKKTQSHTCMNQKQEYTSFQRIGKLQQSTPYKEYKRN